MTIDEKTAKGKWCPFARVSVRDTSVNRYVDEGMPTGTKCVGSFCMAWLTLNYASGEGTCMLIEKR